MMIMRIIITMLIIVNAPSELRLGGPTLTAAREAGTAGY